MDNITDISNSTSADYIIDIANSTMIPSSAVHVTFEFLIQIILYLTYKIFP